jgi:L-asparaginase/Glu-tRNA(Gln) amidotransferase subunit D
MRLRNIYHGAGGGTVGGAGVNEDDSLGSRLIRENLEAVPKTRIHEVNLSISGDSADYQRRAMLESARAMIDAVSSGDGGVASTGSDLQGLFASTTALMGCELLRYPLVFNASMKGPSEAGSDAPLNTLTSATFAAYGNGSGVFCVRPEGIINTSRHDTPAGSIDWHSRRNQSGFRGRSLLSPSEVAVEDASGRPGIQIYASEIRRRGYFARLKIEEIIDPSSRKVILPSRVSKGESLARRIGNLFEYEREVQDGTLDYVDQLPVGGRGWLPPVHMMGYGKDRIVKFKSRPEKDEVSTLKMDMLELVEDLRKKGRVVGRVIHELALIEIIRRHREKPAYKRGDSDLLHQKWARVMDSYLKDNLKLDPFFANETVKFWERQSGVINDDMVFRGIIEIGAGTCPEWFYDSIEANPPAGVIIKASGASGLRLTADPNVNYITSFIPALEELIKNGIPVVLTSSSRGEVTSYEYPPGLRILEEDLAFFGGTYDFDLVQPRLALLQERSGNRVFLNSLVETLDVNGSHKREITRNMLRYLLSGGHYRNTKEGQTSDRKNAEDLHGIETRVDLLSAIHAKKAILATFLHEAIQRNIHIPKEAADVLKK